MTSLTLTGAGRAAEFQPFSLGSLLLEIDADFGVLNSGLALPADGDRVRQITPVNGSYGLTITQTSSGLQPLYKVDQVNGHAAIRGDGSDDSMTGGGISTLTDFTLFAVAKATTAWGAMAFFGDASFNYVGTNDDTTLRVRAGASNTAFSVASLGTAWHIFTVRRESGSCRVYINGVPSASNPATNSGAIAFNFLMNQGFGNRALGGDLTRMVLYTEAKSISDENLVGAYLASRYALSWTDIAA